MTGSPPNLHTMVIRYIIGKPAYRVFSRSRSRSKVTWYAHFLGFLEWATPSLTVWLRFVIHDNVIAPAFWQHSRGTANFYLIWFWFHLNTLAVTYESLVQSSSCSSASSQSEAGRQTVNQDVPLRSSNTLPAVSLRTLTDKTSTAP